MEKQSNQALLRRALLGNAAFSTLCGVTLLVAAGSLAPLLGIPTLALRITGLALLPFAFGLFQNARREKVQRGEAWLAVVLDGAWVLGSAALVLADLWPLQTAGVWAVLVVAEVVLLCAILQAVGLKRTARAATASL